MRGFYVTLLVCLTFVLAFGTGAVLAQGTVTLTLQDSYGNGLSGGLVQYYEGGAWQAAGTTDANGEVFIDGLENTVSFRMYWEDTYIQKNQNISTNPTVIFQTVLVKMELHSSQGATIIGEGQVDAGSWKSLGNTPTAGMELLPATYAFRIYYEDTYIQKNQNVATDPLVIFETVLVKMELHSSLGATLIGEGQVNSGSWKSLGNTPTSGKELLPQTYAFRIYYEDTYIQKNQNVATDPLVIFQTVLVQMELNSSLGGPLSGEGQVDAGTWKSLGNTPTAGMELLPKTYAFRIYYEDTYIQKNQNVDTDPLVIFQTVLVQMELNSSLGGPLSGEGQVDAGTWKSMGTTPTLSNAGGMELLPKTYAFRIYYEDTYIQKNQNVSIDQLVIFETVLVQMELHSLQGAQLTGEGQVNSGSWKSMGLTPTAANDGGMELLPKTYAFRVYYEDTYIQKNQNVATDNLVVFETEVTVQTGTISGTVFVGSVELEGITVSVDGSSLSDQTTDPQGKYTFAPLEAGSYTVWIVPPLGYYILDIIVNGTSTGDDDESINLPSGETFTVDFILGQSIVTNDARSKGYWKHQFNVAVTGKGKAEESEDLMDYITAVDQYYTPYFSIFDDLTKSEWQGILSVKGNAGMEAKAKEQLAALVLNFVSLKIGQYQVVTADNRTAGDVLTYVSELITDGDFSNDELAKDLAEMVNEQQTIGAGIVPQSSILYKNGHGFSSIDWAFGIPDAFTLFQNFPNPFNPNTSITFTVKQPDQTTLKVYNILGQEVATLFKGGAEPSRLYRFDFNGSDLASGVYIYRLQSGTNVSTKVMMLTK